MRGFSLSRRTAVAAVLACVAVGGGAAYASGAASGGGNTYTGCLQFGLVYNVAIASAPSSPCFKGATQISWSQTGPPGTSGAPGAPGATGATGPAGSAGRAGTNGTNGTNGAVGPTGPTGANGTNGAAGAQGATGATGPQGEQGPSGSPADTMLTGRVDAVPGIQVDLGSQGSGAGSGKANPTAYGAPSGISTADTDLADVETLSPGTDSFLAQNLDVQMTGDGVPLLSDDSVVVNLVVNGTTELSCTIPAGSSTCESSGAAAVAPGATLAIGVISMAPLTSSPGESTDDLPVTIPGFDLLFGFEAVG